MPYGVSNAAIAQHLNISRQAVTKHRRRGMPCESVEAAAGWYFCNVSTTRRKRGTYSNLPMRLPAYRFDDDDATAAAIASLSGDDEASDAPPPLDDFPAGFWGTSATKSVLEILGDGSTKAFREREGVLAAFLCIFAAMRLHLRLMPSIMAKRVGARDTEAAEDALMEWSCQFAAHWFGPDFEREPILPTNIEKLSDFYRPLEGKGISLNHKTQVLGKVRKFSTSKPHSAEVAGSL
jgi:hypothetical protein